MRTHEQDQEQGISTPTNVGAAKASAVDNAAVRKSRRRANRLVVGIPVLIAALGLVLSQLWIATLPNQYTATAAIAFSPKVTANGSIPGSESLSLQAAKYIAFIDAQPAIEAASKASGIQTNDLDSGGFVATIVPGTATMTISVTASNGREAAAAANAFVLEVTKRAKTDSVLTAEQVAAASAPSSPSGPQRTVLTVLTAAVSLLVGFVALIIGLAGLRYWRTRPPGERLPEWLRDESSNHVESR